MDGVALNTDTVFRMSKEGAFRVRQVAREFGWSPAKAFRTMAGALVKMPDPKITTYGIPLTATMSVAVGHSIVYELEQMCGDMGVPSECMGELVSCAEYPDKGRWS